MKKLMYVLAVGGLFFTACQKNPGYKINGTADGIADGDTVYLQDYKNGEFVKLDQAIAKNGTFTFTGRQDTAVNRFLTYMKGEKHYVANFFLENGTLDAKLGEESSITGTDLNDKFQNLKADFAKINKEMNDLYTGMRADSTLTEAQHDSIMKVIEKKDQEGMDMVYGVIEKNIDNPLGLYLLPSYASAFELEKQKALIDKIPENMRDERINKLNDKITKAQKTAVGQQFVDFTMQTPDNQTVSLGSYINQYKYTLVDFWASWCGPCRHEMPNVVAAYNKYKNKGFTVVGVSLDQDADKWKQALKDLNMTWPQMSDLKGWASEGASLYGVSAIPATVLIDGNGTIIARDLRGDKLAEKLAELIK